MTESPHRYFAINKPYAMLSQFVGGHPGLPMLGALGFPFPEGTHALGRLDYTSEGLLLLTTNKAITKILFDPGAGHQRSYLVKVYKQVSDATITRLAGGINIRIKGGTDYTTAPAIVTRSLRPDGLPRISHELREDIPHDWLTITLTEGKHRQIRKMLQAVHHPCHRLIRLSIGGMMLGDMASGAVREFSEAEFFEELGLQPSDPPAA